MDTYSQYNWRCVSSSTNALPLIVTAHVKNTLLESVAMTDSCIVIVVQGECVVFKGLPIPLIYPAVDGLHVWCLIKHYEIFLVSSVMHI